MTDKPKRGLWKIFADVMFYSALGALVLIGLLYVLNGVLPAKPRAIEAVFPDKLQYGFILDLKDFPKEISRKRLLFDIDEQGRPFVLLENTLIPLKHEGESSSGVVRLGVSSPVDHFAWMRDGALLTVSGRSLSVMTQEGFNEILRLPDEGMKVEPASFDQFYIYGENSFDIYLYKKGRKLLHLLNAPSPVSAVSGDGDLTFLALGRSVYLFAMGEPLSFVYEAHEEVISLAVSPEGGLFYSTERGVGYISRKGEGYMFIRGRGAMLKARGEDLYLFFADEGIMKCSPVSSFKSLTVSLKKRSEGNKQ